MRVTNSMLTDTVLKNLNNNLNRLNKMQDRMSSGKKVSKPSDEPVYVSRIMRLNSMVKEQEKYQQTMKDAKGFVDDSESALGKLSEVLNRARELAVYGASGSLSNSDRQALASEVDELLNETVEIGNSNYAGRYIFGGYNTASTPFERNGDSAIYNGDDGELEWEISRKVTMPINLSGREVFKSENGDVFEALKSLKENLENDNPNELSDTVIGEVDAAADHILSERAVLGARSKRLETAEDRAFEGSINVTDLLSRLEDVDWAEAVMDYKNAENVHKAALATGSQILQPTLLDYLR